MCGIQNEIQKATNELNSITNDKQNHTDRIGAEKSQPK